MRGMLTTVGVATLLCFVVLLHGSDPSHGGAVETSEDPASKDLVGSGRMSSDGIEDGRSDDLKFSGSKKVARCLGSRQGPSPPAPSFNRMKSMVYTAPPPPGDQPV